MAFSKAVTSLRTFENAIALRAGYHIRATKTYGT